MKWALTYEAAVQDAAASKKLLLVDVYSPE